MADDFDREMHDADWAAVYERQAARGDLVPRLADLLSLAAGDHVLEVGSGPGYTAFRLAAHVSPGVVYALDRQPAALEFLRRTAASDGIDGVHPVAGDAEALPVRFDEPTPAVAAFVLHHLGDPEAAIAQLHGALVDGSRLLVVEYHPDAAGEVGPPTEHRISPARVRTWLDRRGFDPGDPTDLPEEKYAVLARRTSG